MSIPFPDTSRLRAAAYTKVNVFQPFKPSKPANYKRKGQSSEPDETNITFIVFIEVLGHNIEEVDQIC